MNRTLWTPDDLCGRDTFERVVAQLGGDALSDGRELARRTQAILAAQLDPALRPLYLDAQDAASDAAAAHEDTAVQAALLLGAGLGAALASRPGQDPEPILKTVAPALLAALGAPFQHTCAVEAIQSALEGMQRLRAVTLAR